MSIIDKSVNIFDINGINESFYKQYKLLDSKGIQNKDFLLQGCEVNKDLDPNDYNDELTKKQKDRIREKCSHSVWYFIGSVVRIPTISECSPYTLNVQNMSVIYLLENSINVYSNSCRQTYSNITRCAYYLWKIIFKPGFKLKILSPNMEESKFTLQKMLYMNDLLPPYLRLDSEEIRSRVTMIKSPRNWRDVEKNMRGLQGHLFINGFEHIEYMSLTMTYLSPMIQCNALTVDCNSTIGLPSSQSKVAADKLIMSSCKWFDQMLDLKLDITFRNKIFYINYDYNLLVDNPEKWFLEMRLMLNGDQGAIDREVLMVR